MVISNTYFKGRLISIPGSYSKIDASGLETVGLGASGVVAVIGTAVGGKPVSSTMKVDDFLSATRPGKVRSMFRSGDLLEAGPMLFDPSNDANITAGAQKIYFMKTNQSTAATLTRSNANGTVLTLTSTDYGEFNNQINVTQETGTSEGYKLEVNFEDTTESGDNVGGESMFTLQYTEETGLGWDTMTAQVLSGGIRANGTRDEAGLDSVVNSHSAGVLSIVSSSAADTTQQVTVYGLVGATPTREVVTLTGTTPVLTVNAFDVNSVVAAELDAVCAGDVSIDDDLAALILDYDGGGGGTVSITAGNLAVGGVRASTMWVNPGDVVNMVADGASTATVWLVGKNTSGAWVIDRVTLNGAVGVSGAVTTWNEIKFIVLGEVAAARTVSINATAVETLNTAQDTLTKVKDYFNAKQVGVTPYGFVFTMVTGSTLLDPANLDLTGTPVNVDSPSTGTFYADLYWILDWYNNSSDLVNATKTTFAPEIWDITVTAVASGTAYVWTINSTTLTYTSDGSATEAEVVQGIIDLTNRHEDVNGLVTAAAGATSDIIRLTAATPLGFNLSESDSRLTIALIQSTVGVGQAPANTSGAEFLTGGAEGASTASDYQTAIDLLKNIDVNSIVVITHDTSTHAYLSSHLKYMSGVGRSERDGFVGMLNAAGTALPSKAEIKTQTQALNTRHIRAFGQSIDRYSTTGDKTTFNPWAQACVAAGMQAGSSVGTPLTYKYGNLLAFNQASSWNPIDDAEEMLNAGLCFLERVDGVGSRWVRNITTHQSSANLAFQEASVNEAANFASRSFRRNLESAVGKKGFAGTLNAAKGVAIGTLGLLVDQEIIVQYNALSMALSADVLEVDCEIAPVIPVNFVLNTIHLVTVSLTA